MNEGRRSKNRRTSQESELARKANAEALQRLKQSNAMNYVGDVIQENNSNESIDS